MTGIMSALLLPLLAVVIAALTTHKTLRHYFLAQAVCTVSCWLGDKAFGIDSLGYRVIYSGATIPILVVSLMLVWEHGARLPSMFTSGLIAVGLCFVSLRGYHGYFGANEAIVLAEGLSLAFVGMCMCLRAPFVEDMKIAGGLATMWLLMAIYDFYFVLNPRSDVLNYFMPVWLIIALCLWVIIFHPKRSGVRTSH